MIGTSVALNSVYPHIYGNLAASPYAMGIGTVMLSGFLVGYVRSVPPHELNMSIVARIGQPWVSNRYVTRSTSSVISVQESIATILSNGRGQG